MTEPQRYTDVRQALAEAIAKRREECGLTRYATAKRAHCAGSTVRRLEEETETSVSLLVTWRIFKALGCAMKVSLIEEIPAEEIGPPAMRDVRGQILLNGKPASSTKSVGDGR